MKLSRKKGKIHFKKKSKEEFFWGKLKVKRRKTKQRRKWRDGPEGRKTRKEKVRKRR